MINFSKKDNGYSVEFVNNSLYLKNGIMSFPFNALSLIVDMSDMATFRRVATNDVLFSTRIDMIKFDGVQATKENIEQLFEDTCVGATGGGGGDLSNYYTKSQTDALVGAVEDEVDILSGQVESVHDNFGNYYTKDEIDNSEMAIVSALTELNDEMLEKATIVELTQAEYDALDPDYDPDTLYIISDAYPVNMNNYYTKTQTNSLLADKLDASAYTPTDLSSYYTKTETDNLLTNKVSTSDYETTERATSAALNDLNTRLLAVNAQIGNINTALTAINS